MPATTPSRGYPYPLDSDPINVAGDIHALAQAIDVDSAALYAAHAWQQAQIEANAASAANTRTRMMTPSVATFDKPSFDCRIYGITVDANGNGSVAYAAPFGTWPPVICQITAEFGVKMNVTPWSGYLGLNGFAFNFADQDGATQPSAAVQFTALAVGTWP